MNETTGRIQYPLIADCLTLKQRIVRRKFRKTNIVSSAKLHIIHFYLNCFQKTAAPVLKYSRQRKLSKYFAYFIGIIYTFARFFLKGEFEIKFCLPEKSRARAPSLMWRF